MKALLFMMLLLSILSHLGCNDKSSIENLNQIKESIVGTWNQKYRSDLKIPREEQEQKNTVFFIFKDDGTFEQVLLIPETNATDQAPVDNTVFGISIGGFLYSLLECKTGICLKIWLEKEPGRVIYFGENLAISNDELTFNIINNGKKVDFVLRRHTGEINGKPINPQKTR